MIDINWNNYKSKFNGRERTEFERLAYMLFCYEYNIKIGIFRFKNQTGIETEPIEVDGVNIGFQAKYYDTKLSDNKNDIIDSLKKAKTKNSALNKILLYTNQELSESSSTTKKAPTYKSEIEKYANEINVAIEWRVPSHFEKQLSVPENDYLVQYFFGVGNGAVEFLDKIKAHSERILFAIQTNIRFKNHQIKIDRQDILSKIVQNKKTAIILSGDGGSGKTAIIKELFSNQSRPCYVLKAAEFSDISLAAIFGQFGTYDVNDFLRFHKDESNKTFVIDSAEKLADLENLDVFKELLSALINDAWTIIFTTRSSYLNDLSFYMIEVYQLLFDIIKVENISTAELEIFSTRFQFKLPDNSRLRTLICNPFYLNEYLSNYDIINEQTDVAKFRDILWQKKIQDSKFQKDNSHLEREKCFLSLTKERCDTGNFYMSGENCNTHILSLLAKDEIIKHDSTYNGYFITHDIYEEWALEKLIEREYAILTSFLSFFVKIGNSLPIRRAFRTWLSNKIPQAESSIKQFIEQSFNDPTVPGFWKDELLVSVLLSDYCIEFFKLFDNVLLDNDKLLLRKIIFLLRTTCKEVDTLTERMIISQEDTSINPAYVFTKPKGKGWGATVAYIYSKIDFIQKEELSFILPLLGDYVSHRPIGNTARLGGLFALHFYKDAELNEDVHYGREIEKSLLEVVLAAAAELKPELIAITEGLLSRPFNKREAFDSLGETVLASEYESTAYIMKLPEYVIKLADFYWYKPKTENHTFYSSSTGVEDSYSIRHNHEYFPPSALQTPVYLLLYGAFPETIKFILDFTNRAVEAYFASGLDPSAHEIEAIIGSHKTKQIISSCVWNMYRGNGAPVTPYLLQCMHMALEKRLLEFAKIPDKRNLKKWLIHLLENTRSASITAIVTSIVLAYPDELFEIAIILFGNPEFYTYDNLRAASESEAKSLYSIGARSYKKERYTNERLATCNEPHRRISLEILARNYQYFKNEHISNEEADNRQKQIWKVVDYLYTTIPSEDLEADKGKIIRLLLARIDRRKMNPVVSKTEDGVIINFNPNLDNDLKEYSDEAQQIFEDKFKYNSLKFWAISKVEKHTQYGPSPEYEEHPELVLKETKEILDVLKQEDNEAFYMLNSSTPSYTCSALIRRYSDKLTEDELLFCCDIVMDYAASPLRENYGYQISDGVEAAIGTLPFLYKLVPEKKVDFNTILLFILFDAYPLGGYKRICDYAIEAIGNSLFELSPNDANTILLGYMFFKPKFDAENPPLKRLRERKSRAEILNDFFTKYEPELMHFENGTLHYDKIDFSTQGIKTAETAFQIIPAETIDPTHLDYIKKLLDNFSSELLKKTKYSDDSETDYKLKHRFNKKFAKFLLNRDVSSIAEWTRPFTTAFTITEEMANFLSDIVSEEDRLYKYDSFWSIWNCFYPKIKSAVQTESTKWHLDKIINNYLLAWPWWEDTAKEWRSLREREKLFFRKACLEIGGHPAVLFSIAKFLNQVGSTFIDDGIIWIADMLADNTNLHIEDLPTNTIYYLEILARRYVYLNRTKLKTSRIIKDKVLVLLNFLVAKGSVSGYLLREDIY